MCDTHLYYHTLCDGLLTMLLHIQQRLFYQQMYAQQQKHFHVFLNAVLLAFEIDPTQRDTNTNNILILTDQEMTNLPREPCLLYHLLTHQNSQEQPNFH